MRKFLRKIRQRYIRVFVFLLGILTVLFVNWLLDYTSTNEFCAVCHVHPQAKNTWRLSTHYDNKSGVIVSCVECHLPPGGLSYLTAKITTGMRDVYGKIFKDVTQINWELKSTRDYAAKHVYKTSCLNCHKNLYPRTLSKKGEDAHLYYDQRAQELRCINCHLEVGHYHEKPADIFTLDKEQIIKQIYDQPTVVDSFVNFTEKIPGTSVDFEMISIPGGTFTIGSPESEPYRQEDEGPRCTVQISPFWMAKHEVSWDEYDAFFKETKTEGRTDDQYKYISKSKVIDSFTGPTPPYGNPDQGWGKEKRPAITMTHYAAQQYCEWLSLKTGKRYRLPTEAEWEYACRGETQGAYFFPGNPEQYAIARFWNKIFGTDTVYVNTYVKYLANSEGKTFPPSEVNPNPFGLVHLLGNVKEFCADFYAQDAYAQYTQDHVLTNPQGTTAGTEHVIRGGSYKSDADQIRIANRDHTKHDAWLLTDPQIPKSLWWYSDCNDVGFRVVCEYKLD